MFQLDESFLESMGLSGMRQEEKGPFLEHMQEELETRVGEKISEGMSDEQLGEFEKISDGDIDAVNKIIEESGDYKVDPVYVAMVEKGGFEDGAISALAEYASMKWMMKNRPNYREIVEGVLADLRKDIEANKAKLLGGA